MTSVAEEIEEQEDIARGWFVGLGILLVLTGVGALVFPMVATLSVELLVGSVMLVGGVVTLIHAFKNKEWGGFFLELIVAGLHILAGVIFLANPFAGMFALTAMLAVFFVVDGIIRMVLAINVRPEKAWAWFLASGLMSLLLGILIAVGIANGTSLAFIGFMVGINLMFAGVSYIAFGNEGGFRIIPSTLNPKSS
ncbi:HdeD family acid-resistance protein [Erythrobacter sp. THAF29]|uniref:HdeD family acid-resistance protein n=1 Tax=Erythrobacter sp. THAF29 TaxID=2587851 RepID=UPI0012A8ED41|nr:HdeD family acid-resistance protein [Erythrobacter sp. THAF29]QFT78526.1 acid-resistance membrane protein [Erythrobacter sp. THAF29]